VHLSVVAVTFGLIFVAELPDKTMIASVVMAGRYRPLAVWVGAASAMLVNAAVAVAAGRLLALLPHRDVDAVVAALVAAGALYLLLSKESTQEREGEETAERARRFHRIAAGAFIVIVLAEIGDITQVLTANLAAHYRDPWSVLVGSATALVLVVTIGVIAGQRIVRVLPLSVIRKGGAFLLGGFAVYSAVKAATG
jgi:putative Ca2+/H+ antiporter (TMEM165/GDT1 family)